MHFVHVFCPRCSGAIEFADDAGDHARSECSCGLRFSLGELRRIEWKQAFEDRIKANDALQWWHDPPSNGQRAGWLLVKLASPSEFEQQTALDQLRHQRAQVDRDLLGLALALGQLADVHVDAAAAHVHHAVGGLRLGQRAREFRGLLDFQPRVFEAGRRVIMRFSKGSAPLSRRTEPISYVLTQA